MRPNGDILDMSWRRLSLFIENAFFKTIYIWLSVLPALASILRERGTVVCLGRCETCVLDSGALAQTDGCLRLTLEIPFSWVLLYFAAVSLSVARGLYALACPKFIRTFRDAGDAQARGATVYVLLDHVRDFFREGFALQGGQSSEFKTAIRRLTRQCRIDDADFVDAYNSDQAAKRLAGLFRNLHFSEVPNRPTHYQLPASDTQPARQSNKDIVLRTIFWDLERVADRSKPVLRMACASACILGLVLVLITVASGLTYVLEREVLGRIG